MGRKPLFGMTSRQGLGRAFNNETTTSGAIHSKPATRSHSCHDVDWTRMESISKEISE